MAKTKEMDGQAAPKMQVKITLELTKAIEDLIFQQKRIASDKEALKEATTAVAEKLGIKAGELSGRINMIIKEEEKGGAIKSKTQEIDFVEEYFTVKSNHENK